MEAIGGAPETIGQKVAAALVGTFLGILLCYGVVGPLAARLEHLSEAEAQYLHVLRIAIVASRADRSPILAVEYARRSIPVELRPGFLEMEMTIKRDAKVPPPPRAPRVPRRHRLQAQHTPELARRPPSASAPERTAAHGRWPTPTSSPP